MLVGGAFILALGGFGVIIGLVAFTLGRRSRVRSVSRPCCGRCLYAVAGLTSLTCPECGSDLRVVGILTPAMRRPTGPWLAIILWTLALPVPALVISGVLSSLIMPERHEYEERWLLTPTSDVGVTHIDFTASASSWNWPWNRPGDAAWHEAPDTLRFAVFAPANGSAPRGELIVDLDRSAWRTSSDLQDRPLTDLNGETLGAWLAETCGEPAQALAAPVDSIVDSIAASSLGRTAITPALRGVSILGAINSTQSGSMSMSGPLTGSILALLGFWVVVWLLVSVLLYRRQTRTATG